MDRKRHKLNATSSEAIHVAKNFLEGPVISKFATKEDNEKIASTKSMFWSVPEILPRTPASRTPGGK